MAKYDEREGNSCHIHLSLRGHGRRRRLLGRRPTGPPLYDHFIAGVLATMRDFTLLYAPNINSYKRFAAGSFAPTADRLGRSTTAPARCGWSARARAPGWRTGCPAATSTRYLALAAMLAGGLHGIEHELPLEDELVGNAYTSGKAAGAAHAARGPRRRSRPPTVARAGLR